MSCGGTDCPTCGEWVPCTLGYGHPGACRPTETHDDECPEAVA